MKTWNITSTNIYPLGQNNFSEVKANCWLLKEEIELTVLFVDFCAKFNYTWNNLTDSALFKKFNFCLVFLPENVPTGSFLLIIEQKWLQWLVAEITPELTSGSQNRHFHSQTWQGKNESKEAPHQFRFMIIFSGERDVSNRWCSTPALASTCKKIEYAACDVSFATFCSNFKSPAACPVPVPVTARSSYRQTIELVEQSHKNALGAS